MDEQAVTLLLKATDTLGINGEPCEAAKQKFSETFVDPLGAGLVANVRESLGLQPDGGLDILRGLVMEGSAESNE